MNEATMMDIGHTQEDYFGTQLEPLNGDDSSIELSHQQYWGLLQCKANDNLRSNNIIEKQEYLEYRIKDGFKDTYCIGRDTNRCDIVVADNRVSSIHCKIYCDYSDISKVKIFIQDSSANGIYINNANYHYKGQSIELKSGDVIYLVHPKNSSNIASSNSSLATQFTFINNIERLLDNRERRPNLSLQPVETRVNNFRRRVEDYYIIGDRLGSGVSGEVRICMNKVDGLKFAAKIIDFKKFLLTPGLSPEEIYKEAEMLRELDHPNIIKVKDTFETDHGICIILELVYGGDLFDRIIERKVYSEDNSRIVIKNILTAVEYLHSKGIVHRDLKPENILLSTSESDTDIKITDFGLAKHTNAEGLKSFVGTPFYFAPEVLRRKDTIMGTGRYGQSADMWSIGVILFILLSGVFPFDEENLYDQIGKAKYSFEGSQWRNISDNAKDFIKRLMTLRPDKRISVSEALRHPWIVGNSLESVDHSTNISSSSSMASGSVPSRNESSSKTVSRRRSMKPPTSTPSVKKKKGIAIDVTNLNCSFLLSVHSRRNTIERDQVSLLASNMDETYLSQSNSQRHSFHSLRGSMEDMNISQNQIELQPKESLYKAVMSNVPGGASSKVTAVIPQNIPTSSPKQKRKQREVKSPKEKKTRSNKKQKVTIQESSVPNTSQVIHRKYSNKSIDVATCKELSDDEIEDFASDSENIPVLKEKVIELVISNRNTSDNLQNSNEGVESSISKTCEHMNDSTETKKIENEINGNNNVLSSTSKRKASSARKLRVPVKCLKHLFKKR